MAKRHVLDGVRMLDFSQHVAGPACTRMMAEMGAEIIKLELAPFGEQIRNVGFKVNGRGVYFIQQNRGKKTRMFRICHDPNLLGTGYYPFFVLQDLTGEDAAILKLL